MSAVPVHYFLLLLPQLWHLGVVLIVVFVGIWSAHGVATAAEEDDPQIVVVDESASVLLALWIAMPAGLAGVIAAVILFRVLDIFKPWPIYLAERLRPAGLGIMADDIAAGLGSGIAVLLCWQMLLAGAS